MSRKREWSDREMLGNIPDLQGKRRLKAWWFPSTSFFPTDKPCWMAWRDIGEYLRSFRRRCLKAWWFSRHLILPWSEAKKYLIL